MFKGCLERGGPYSLTKIVNKSVNQSNIDDFIDSLSCFRTVFRQSGSANTSALESWAFTAFQRTKLTLTAVLVFEV